MSLLLEALKKAELAKQGAKPGAAGPAALDFEPAPAAQQTEAPVMTRENLPEIPRSADIDFASNRPPVRESATPRSADAPSAAAETAELPRYEPTMQDMPPASPDRAAARQLFEAKEMDYNPKRPFYITLGLLSLAALGYGGYLWWQLQPRAVYSAQAVQAAQKSAPVTPAPIPQAATPGQSPAGQNGSPPPAGAPAAGDPQPQALASPQATAAAPAPVAQAGSSPSRPQPETNRPTPSSSSSMPPRPAAAIQSTVPVSPARAGGATSDGVSRSSSAPQTRPGATVRSRLSPPVAITPSIATVDPTLERAYAAYQNGDLVTAREQYQAVLQREAGNRDALLGLAAIDMRTRNFETAEIRYLRLIEIDPRDSHAHAGLLALRGQLDPVQAESRIKTMLADQPESTHLYFSLGNQYAQQQRWPEAQQAYFRAFSAEPENPDYAFNLAVALDHLRQKKLALEYYQRALALAGGRTAGFDKARADSRIQELQR